MTPLNKSIIYAMILFLLIVPLTFAITSSQNFQYRENATQVNLTYDKLNRVLQKNATDIFNYSYDTKNGTLTNVTSTSVTSKYTYDNKYRVANETIIIDNITFTQTYLYDASNRIINITLSAGQTLNYSYNDQGLLETIPTILSNASYSEADKPANRTSANNMSSVLTYNDTTLRLSRIRTGTMKQINTGLIQDIQYSYDNVSNILQMTDTANNMTYIMQYDDLNRLTYANRTGPIVPETYEFNYTYDSIGNLLTVMGASANITFTYNGSIVHAPSSVLFLNYAPTHSTPILNSSRGKNLTIENLSVYSVDTFDKNLDEIKNIISWYRNTTPLLILNMPFDGGTNATYARDYSGRNHIGNGTGNVVWENNDSFDSFGIATFTRPTSSTKIYYNLTGTNTLNLNNDSFSIEAWVLAYGSNVNSGDIVVKGDIASAEGSMFWLRHRASGSGNIEFLMGNTTTFTQSIAAQNYSDGKWHHIVAVRDKKNNRQYLYVDNIVRDNDTNTLTNLRDAASPLVSIGDHGKLTAVRAFNGSIAALRIWNLSLSSEQIQLLWGNRTDTLLDTITDEKDVWQAAITPNDGLEEGPTLFSNTLTIRSSPTQDDAILNSTYGTNITTENLTVYNTSTFDAQGDAIINIISWYRNNTPLLILNMPFEGGTNTTFGVDYSGRNHTGNGTGVVWVNTSGYDGFGVANFTRASSSTKIYYNLTGTNTLNLNNDSFSIEAWVLAYGSNVNSGDIVVKGDVASAQGSMFWLRHRASGSGNIEFLMGNTTSFTQSIATQNYSDGKWHHVVAVRDKLANRQYLYVDNIIRDNDSNVLTNLRDAANPTFVSVGDHGKLTAVRAFNGSIAALRIWNISLPPEQITLLWNNRTDMLDWRMTAANETWNASIMVNDRRQDGELRFTNLLDVRQVIELILGYGSNNMSSTTYKSSFTLDDQPMVHLNSTNYNVTLGWFVYK